MGGRGSAPNPAGGAHSAPPDPLAGGLVRKGLTAPSNEPHLRFRPLGRGPQTAVFRASLNQCPGMRKSKSGHPSHKTATELDINLAPYCWLSWVHILYFLFGTNFMLIIILFHFNFTLIIVQTAHVMSLNYVTSTTTWIGSRQNALGWVMFKELEVYTVKLSLIHI